MIGTNAVLNGFSASAGSWIAHASLLCALLFGTTSFESTIPIVIAHEKIRTMFMIAHAILIVTNLIMNYGNTASNPAIKFTLYYTGLLLYLFTLG
jgi:hypothetical protein